MKKVLITSIIWVILVALTVVCACTGMLNEGVEFVGGTNVQVRFHSDINKEEYDTIASSLKADLEKAGYKVGNGVGITSANDYCGIEFSFNAKPTADDKTRIEGIVKSVVSDAKVDVYDMKPVAENPFVMMTIGMVVTAILIGIYVLIRSFKKDRFASAIAVALNIVFAVAVFNVVEVVLSLIGFEYTLASVAFSAVAFLASAILTFTEISAKREGAKCCKFAWVLSVLTVVIAILLVAFGSTIAIAVELALAVVIPAVLVRPMINLLYTVPAEGKNN